MKKTFSANRIYSQLFEKPKPQKGKALSADIIKAKRDATLKSLTANEKPNLSQLKDFVAKYSGPEKYNELFGEEMPGSFDQSAIDKEIREAYKLVNKKYKYFPQDSDDAYEKFAKCYKAVKFKQFSEKGLSDDLTIEGAYKVTAFFDGDLRILDQTINSSMKTSVNPFHDIAIIPIPDGEDYGSPGFDITKWQKLVRQTKDGTSKRILDSFQHAPIITEKIFLKNIKEIETEIVKQQYKDAGKDPELARIFARYKIPEERFKKALEFKEKLPNAEAEETIPKVVANVQGYYAVKLPSNDPRALILGDITGCCQSFDGDSAMCVRDGITLPNNGFYVYLKPKDGVEFDPKKIDWKNLEESAEIVGQSYVWKGKKGNVCLDSLEVREGRQKKSFPAIELASALGNEFIAKDDSISRVSLGEGGGTESFHEDLKETKHASIAEFMLTGKMYRDALSQYELVVSNELKQARERAKEITGQDVSITNPDQISKLENYKNQKGEFPKNLDQYLTIDLMSGDEIGTSRNIDENLAEFITSESAIICYEYGATPKMLTSIDDQKRAALTSDDAIQCYLEGVKFTDLIDFDIERINALTYAPECYEAGLTPAMFAGMDAEKIKALTRWQACECYEAGLTPPMFKEMDIKTAKLLTSEYLAKWYKAGVTLDEMSKQDIEKIKILAPYNLADWYKDGIEFKDLIALDIKKAKALNSSIGRLCIEQNITDAKHLFELSTEKIKLLTSEKAYNLYRLGLEFNKLSELDVEKITLLSNSNQSLDCFMGGVKIEDLAGYDAEKIHYLISLYSLELKKTINIPDSARDYDFEKDIEKYSKNVGKNFDKLAKLDAEELKKLSSDAALACYDNGAIPSMIADFTQEKINTLGSYDAIEFYESGRKLDQLKNFEVEKIKALISRNAQKCYQAGVDFDDIAKLDAKKIEALTSRDALLCYESELTPAMFAGMDIEKIKILTSDKALRCYEAGIRPEMFEEIDTAKAKILTSYDAIGSYKSGIKLNQLKDFEEEKIKALISGNAQECYQVGIDFDDLTKLDTKKIDALTSHLALHCYRNGAEFAEIKNYDAEKIETLTSYEAYTCYRAGANVQMVANMHKEKIKALSSWKAESFLKNGVAFEELAKLDTEKLKALTTDQSKALDCFKEGVAFEELVKLPSEEIKALTKDDVSRLKAETKENAINSNLIQSLKAIKRRVSGHVTIEAKQTALPTGLKNRGPAAGR